MVCNYCFENENLSNYIKEYGSKAVLNFQCTTCNSSDEDIYILPKKDLAQKNTITICNGIFLFHFKYSHFKENYSHFKNE